MKDERFEKYYKSQPYFRIENPNPCWKEKRGYVWDRGDCVVRALANSTGCSWIEAYDYLSAKARRDFNVPNDSDGFRKWVQEDGAKWVCPKVGRARMTAKEFAESHKGGRYILRLAHHEAAVVDGVILDAWNCGERSIYGYLDMIEFRLP